MWKTLAALNHSVYGDPLGALTAHSVYAEKFYGPLGREYFGRAATGAFSRSTYAWCRPRQLAHADWREGMTIKMYACDTGAGANPVARQLAIRMGALVIAPTTAVQVWPFGGYHFNSAQRAAGGRWKLFIPRLLTADFGKPSPLPITPPGK